MFEFCDSSLEDVLKSLESDKKYMDMNCIKLYIKEILNGLNSLHEVKVVHRDLKPENILLKGGVLKICDLGSSKKLDD